MSNDVLPDLRSTPQRRAVLDALRASHDHPTAAEVYERVRAALPGVGAATVYRTLGLLVASGRALELSLGDAAAARYDANTERHDHLICLGCSRAVDVDAHLPAGVGTDLERRTGFAVTSYDLQFHGRCPDCRRSGSHPTP